MHYGILLPGFWGGDTGRRIANLGGSVAQLLALYLMSNKDATMIGLYPVELAVIRAHIGTLTMPAILKGFDALHRAEFATYDAVTSHVWVKEMAKYRLNLHRAPLKASDNKVEGAHRLYKTLRPNPFLEPFYLRYRKDLHMLPAMRRRGEAPWKPLGRDSGVPLKPVTGSVTGSGSITEDQEKRSTAAAASGFARLADRR